MRHFNSHTALYTLHRLVSLKYVFAAAALTMLMLSPALFLFPRSTFALDSPYTITGDYIIFNIDSKIISCTGDVELRYKAIQINADSMQIDVNGHILTAQGNIQIISTLVSGQTVQPIETEEMETVNLEEVIERETGGNQRIYHGDAVVYDLNYFQGVVIQTRTEVRKIYLLGEKLEETAAIQNLKEYVDLSDDPGGASASVTAEKFRISPNVKYEAWKATMWVKGTKVINLPYYTNTGRGMLPGKWRLRNASYSTNNNWSLGAEVRYKSARGKRGAFNIDYRDKGVRQYLLGLSQQLTFGRTVGGMFSMSNLGSGSRGMNLSLNRYSSGTKYQNLSLQHTAHGSQSMNFSFSAKLKKAPIQGSLTASRLPANDSDSTNASLLMGGRSKYLGRHKNLGFRTTMSLMYYESDPGTGGVANWYTGISFFRTAIRAGKNGLISTTVNYGHGATTDGNLQNKIDGTVNYNYQIKKTGVLNLSFSHGKNRTSRPLANPTTSNFSIALNLNGRSLWNARLATSYSLTNSKFNNLNLFLDRRLSGKTYLSSTMTYNTERHNLLDVRYMVRYNLHGTTVNTQWLKEGNDFVVDFNSQFQ
ncbi:MAG: hypothetical protein AB1546_13305 [bacterium]